MTNASFWGSSSATNPTLSVIWQPSEQGDTKIKSGNLSLLTAGAKVNIATGANASCGTSAAMTTGSVTVATTAITANSQVHLTPNTLGTVTKPQALYVSARTAGTSFTITSADATDTSTVDWLIVN
jgi:hypothetical protein